MLRGTAQRILAGSRTRLQPSAVRGAGRLMDLGGTFRADAVRSLMERSRKRKTAAEALASDWERVGSDLDHAVARFAKTQNAA